MLGVVIPAHNEEALIDGCLRSVIRASLHPALVGEEVRIFVVVDSCSDETAAIARALGAQVLSVEKRNVGAARATGAAAALSQRARWLSFTDADTTVADDWLVQQLRCGTDAVCGVIGVEDWTGHSSAVREDFVATYLDADGHRHIHGANLGVAATAYRLVNGFQPRIFNEDVALVEALIAAGATIAWSAAPRVVTSAQGSNAGRPVASAPRCARPAAVSNRSPCQRQRMSRVISASLVSLAGRKTSNIWTIPIHRQSRL